MWLQRGYGWLLSRLILRPRAAFASVGVLALIALSVVPNLGQSLLPDFKERDFLMHFLTKPGTSLGEEVRITTASAHELQAIPGIRNFGAHIGQAYQSDEPVGPEFGENWVSVDPKADYDETRDAVQGVMDSYPGLIRDVQTYLKERIREVLAGSAHPIVIRIFGPDLEVLRTKAKEVNDAIAGVRGIADLHVEPQTEIPHVQVEVNLEAAQRHGLKPGDVRRAAAVLVAGEEVGDIFRDGKAYDVPVWSAPESRDSLNDLREPAASTPPPANGVRLADVASIEVKPSPNVVKHEGVARKIDVEAEVDGRDLGSVVREVESELAKIDFPAEYHAEMLGEYQERQAANRRLASLGIFAAIAILFLLQASFGSFRLACLSFLTLPMAVVGGALAAHLGGGMISLGLDGGLPHRHRHRGSQRDHADQPLPAPGGRRGPALRARPGDPRRPGTGGPDHDDGADHGPGPRAPDRGRVDPRARDRAPHGGGDLRGTGGLDPDQPVRRALPLPPVRQEPPAAGGRLTRPPVGRVVVVRSWRERAEVEGSADRSG